MNTQTNTLVLLREMINFLLISLLAGFSSAVVLAGLVLLLAVGN